MGFTMCNVVIGNQNSEYIMINVLGRLHSDSDNYYDTNWLSCNISTKVGCFIGEVKSDICLRTDEFQRFLVDLESLYDSLKGKAEYSTMEDWIKIEMSGDGQGHIKTKGFVIDKHCDGNRLDFTINLDQTNLPKIIKDLKELLEKYPVISK